MYSGGSFRAQAEITCPPLNETLPLPPNTATTAVRFPTPQRVDGSTQRTSVEVTDPLLCPPELELCVSRVSHPC